MPKMEKSSSKLFRDVEVSTEKSQSACFWGMDSVSVRVCFPQQVLGGCCALTVYVWNFDEEVKVSIIKRTVPRV